MCLEVCRCVQCTQRELNQKDTGALGNLWLSLQIHQLLGTAFSQNKMPDIHCKLVVMKYRPHVSKANSSNLSKMAELSALGQCRGSSLAVSDPDNSSWPWGSIGNWEYRRERLVNTEERGTARISLGKDYRWKSIQNLWGKARLQQGTCW